MPIIPIGLDICSDYKLDVYASDLADGYVRIGGTVFNDPHPPRWLDAVRSERRVLLIAGEPQLFTHPDRRSDADPLSSCSIAVVGLVIRP